MDAYIEPEGAELLCEDCCSEDASSYPDGGGESDCPEHCAVCHVPLENTLTSDGVEYVLEAIRGSLRDGRVARDTVHACYKGTYYEGSRHCEIVRDWAEQLSGYRLEDRQAHFVDVYLRFSGKRS